MNDLVEVYIGKVVRAGHPIRTPIFKLGGSPVFTASLTYPLCKSCGKRMDFLAQIPLDRPFHFSSRFAMAYVFMCFGSLDEHGGMLCETWRPFSGANAVLLADDSGSRIIPEGAVRYPEYAVEFSADREPGPDLQDAPFPDGPSDPVFCHTKVGGVPAWIQKAEPPACPTCGREMRFVAQIDAELDGPLPADPGQFSKYNFFQFGDAGLGYVFLCEKDCTARGAFLWQST